MLGDAAEQLAGYVGHEADKPDVADALDGLTKAYLADADADRVQAILSDAFKWAEDAVEMVPDINGNGYDYGESFAEACRADEEKRKRESKGNGQAGKGQRFTLKRFEDIQISPEPNYLVKGLLPRVELAVIWGPPKCGKSFWAFDLVMHVTLDWQYRGRRVQQGPAVYLALEGGSGFAGQVEAWRQRHLAKHKDPVPFYLLDVPIDMVAEHKVLIAAIRAQIGDQAPACVVIDTLNRALIGDENKSDDMAKFIRAADLIRLTFDCLVIVIHHCGIQGGRPRGHTSLPGADDVQIAVERDHADNIVCRVEFMKDGESGAAFVSRLERVELGEDKDGDTITSCVIVPVEGGTPAKRAKLTATTKLALEQLQELIGDCGAVSPASNHIPHGVLTCPVALWREQFYRACVADKRDTKKKAFGRAVSRLQELNIIGVWDDKVWLAGQAGHAGH